MDARLAVMVGGAAMVAGTVHAAPVEYQDQVLAQGPILWYSMNAAAGNEANRGSLGASHDGAYNGTAVRGVSTFAGDAAVGFDSLDDFMESLGVSPLTGNPDFTIEAIIRLSAAGGQNYGPFLHWGPSGTGRDVYFSVSNNSNTVPYVGFYNAGLRTTTPVASDEWLHLVWTRRGGTASNAGSRLFVNGRSVPLQVDPVLVPGILNPGQIDVMATTFRINRATDFNRRFTGAIDEIALYDRRFSTAEVRASAAATGLDVLASCAGDASGDGSVNFEDLNIVLGEFSSEGDGLDGDLTLNGVVDFADLNQVLSNFGTVCE